jgi:uncharacterized protein (DUF433 family)
MKAAVLPNYIELDDEGRAWVVGTNTRVDEIVANKLGWGWDADKIHANYPHLPLSKIHAAFAYYYENQAEMDAMFERWDAEDEAARLAQGETPFEKRMRGLGLLP